jgi:ketosteroid isomerase-like protein
MTRDALQAVFDAYADAFVRQDADALSAAWMFPALISGPAGGTAFDEALFRRNLAAMFGFYTRQGVGQASARVGDIHSLGDHVVAANIHYALATADGAPIVAWETAYLLRDAGHGPRSFAAVFDGEVAAWAARGTPLGGRA